MDNYKNAYTELLKQIGNMEQESVKMTISEINNEITLDLAKILQNISSTIKMPSLKVAEMFSGLYSDVVKNFPAEIAYSMGELTGQVKLLKTYENILKNDSQFQDVMLRLTKTHQYIPDLMKEIYEHPGIQHKELADRLNIGPNYLSELTKKLADIKAIQKNRAGKYTFYELSVKGLHFYDRNQQKTNDKKENKSKMTCDLNEYIEMEDTAHKKHTEKSNVLPWHIPNKEHNHKYNKYEELLEN